MYKSYENEYIYYMLNNSEFQSVEVFYLKSNDVKLKKEKYHFRFLYVVKGTGFYSFFDNSIPYQKGTLVLITPDDIFDFQIKKESEFLIIQFHLTFLTSYRWKTIPKIENLLSIASQTSGEFLHIESDKELVANIIKGMLINIRAHALYAHDVNLHFTNTLIVIAARNLSINKPQYFSEQVDNKIEEILSYIESNIHKPDLLKAKLICSTFGVSINYFSNYFKANCGANFKEYIASYRIKLIKHRLLFGDKRMRELAEEFGFTDISHLNRYFKNYSGMSIRDFKHGYSAE